MNCGKTLPWRRTGRRPPVQLPLTVDTHDFRGPRHQLIAATRRKRFGMRNALFLVNARIRIAFISGILIFKNDLRMVANSIARRHAPSGCRTALANWTVVFSQGRAYAQAQKYQRNTRTHRPLLRDERGAEYGWGKSLGTAQKIKVFHSRLNWNKS